MLSEANRKQLSKREKSTSRSFVVESNLYDQPSFLYDEEYSFRLANNLSQSQDLQSGEVASSDDASDDEPLDEEDERAVEAAERRVKLKKDIINGHT